MEIGLKARGNRDEMERGNQEIGTVSNFAGLSSHSDLVNFGTAELEVLLRLKQSSSDSVLLFDGGSNPLVGWL